MKNLLVILATVVVCISSALNAAESLRDDTILATLPKVRLQGLSMEEAMYSLQRKAGSVDPALGVSLARKNLQMGAMADDVRRYGSALAILESIPAEKRVSGDYQRALADVQSVLHHFDNARSTLTGVLGKEPKDDGSRRKLFYLDILRGDLASAKKHCAADGGFADRMDRTLCGYHSSLVSGRLLSLNTEAVLYHAIKKESPERLIWIADILLEQNFLKCLTSGSESCQRLIQYVHSYIQVIAGDKTRLAYAADRMLMANLPEDALKILPDSSNNLALGTRRLTIISKIKNPVQWTESDKGLQKIVVAGLRNEIDRGLVEHAREAALVAFFVDKNNTRGKDLAMLNWATQREWIDLWLMQQALSSTHDQSVTTEIDKWTLAQDVQTPFAGIR